MLSVDLPLAVISMAQAALQGRKKSVGAIASTLFVSCHVALYYQALDFFGPPVILR